MPAENFKIQIFIVFSGFMLQWLTNLYVFIIALTHVVCVSYRLQDTH